MPRVLFFFLALCALTLASCSSGKQQPANPLEVETLAEVNHFRAQNNRSPLPYHAGLHSIALQHSEEMLATRTMSHANFPARLAQARKKHNVGALSENVQSSWGITPTAPRIVQQWKDSPEHRQNMLSRTHFAAVAIAQEGDRIYSTLLFGSPRL